MVRRLFTKFQVNTCKTKKDRSAHAQLHQAMIYNAARVRRLSTKLQVDTCKTKASFTLCDKNPRRKSCGTALASWLLNPMEPFTLLPRWTATATVDRSTCECPTGSVRYRKVRGHSWLSGGGGRRGKRSLIKVEGWKCDYPMCLLHHNKFNTSLHIMQLFSTSRRSVLVLSSSSLFLVTSVVIQIWIVILIQYYLFL